MNILDNIDVKNTIITNCREGYGVECCGIIVDLDGETKVFACKNIAGTPERDFLISNLEIKDLSAGGKVIGFYHSQPDSAVLSQQDRHVLHKIQIKSIIYCVQNGDIQEYSPEPGWTTELTGRPFVPGYLDCSELVRDFYQKQLNITLPKLEHEIKYMLWPEILERWSKLQHHNRADNNFLYNYFVKCRFYELPRDINKKDLRRGDIILCRAKEIEASVHCLIYIRGDQILHHPSQRESTYDDYNDFYKKLTTHILRYNG